MKLFGTIVYPKNRYLTLQFSKGGKNVMCEDYFDHMVRFVSSFLLSFTTHLCFGPYISDCGAFLGWLVIQDSHFWQIM